MLEKFIDRILDLAQIETFEHKERVYSKDVLREITPPEFVSPEPLLFKTLSGMVDHIKAGQLLQDSDKGVFLQVDDYNKVSLRGELQPENSNNRFLYATSMLAIVSFQFSEPTKPIWYDLENFIIAVQSQFVQTDSIKDLIAHLGKIANENIVTVADDSFSQTIQVETGITTKSSVKITNPITIAPYRTFAEVDQPISHCIFRMKSQGGMQCAMFIADGGKWKLDAIKNIKAWLAEQLPDIKVIA